MGLLKNMLKSLAPMECPRCGCMDVTVVYPVWRCKNPKCKATGQFEEKK